MMTFATAVAEAMIKNAEFTTYDHYGLAKSREYHPPKAEPIKTVKTNDGQYTYRLDRTKPENGIDLNWGRNKPENSKEPELEYGWFHGFTPTISGTGGGRPYWNEPDNPFAP